MKELNIYIVDDDEDDRVFFREALESISVKTSVTEFDNGVDLMDRLFTSATLPHVIFLDLYMPIMDGFECLLDIRSFKKFENIHIIAYSTVVREREVKQLKKDGANQFLMKASSIQQLKNMLTEGLLRVNTGIIEEVKDSKFVVLN